MCLEMVAKTDCFMTFPGNTVRLKGLEFPGFSFLFFLKMGVTFALFQSSGASWNCCGLLKVAKNGLAVETICCFSADASMDLCVFGLFNVLQPSVSPLRVNLHCFQLYLWSQGWRSVLPITKEVKKTLNTLVFSVSFITESPAPSRDRPTFP